MTSVSTPADGDVEPQYLTVPAEIYMHLVRLQKAKAVLMLSMGGGQRYRSSLLQIDRQTGRMAIDEVVPLDGNNLLRHAPGLTMSAQSDAGPSYWQIPAGTLQGGLLDGLPCHWLPLPTEIRYMQRRRSFRASFLIGQAPPLAIVDEDGAVVADGEMLDVSEHGCRFLIKVGAPLEWAASRQRLQLRIEPQGLAAFEVAGEVRHAVELNRQEAFMIGIHFLQVEPAVSRRLSQLVVQVQRERRRQQLAMDLD